MIFPSSGVVAKASTEVFFFALIILAVAVANCHTGHSAEKNTLAEAYRADKSVCKTYLSRTQAGPGRAVKEHHKQTSPNHVQELFLSSVILSSFPSVYP